MYQVYLSAAITRSMRLLTAKQSTALNSNNISVLIVHNPRILPILAVSSQITASTGSTLQYRTPKHSEVKQYKRIESKVLLVYARYG